MLIEHLLELFGVQRTRAVVVKLKKDVFNIVLRLQLRLRLHVKVLCCLLVTGLEPVLRCLSPHHVAYTTVADELKLVNRR